MSKLSEAIPNRVRALRQERGWSLAELAGRAGTSPSQVMKLEKSQRRLDFEWTERLASAFGISERELIGMDEGLSAAVRMVPLIGRIAAGNWREAVEQPVDFIPAPAGVGGPHVFALQPQGDSMNMLVPEGGFVLIDPDDAELRNGKTYAVMNAAGETTLKRYRNEPARLEPCSSNAEHSPIVLGREAFTVIGRAISAITAL